MSETIHRIGLSPALRERLRIAMQAVYEQLPEAFQTCIANEVPVGHHQLLLDAYSAALLPAHGTDYAAFGLAPPSVEEENECIALVDALTRMATAKGTPAVLIEGLPEDSDLNYLALLALSASLNTGRRYATDVHDTNEALTVKHVAFGDTALRTHADEYMHADFVGLGATPKLRILGGDKIGSNPLPTKVATIDELLGAITAELWPHPELHHCVDIAALKEDLFDLFHTPLFYPTRLAHNDADNITTQALLFTNPHLSRHPEAPTYGLYAMAALHEDHPLDNARLETLKRLGFSEAFFRAACSAFNESLTALKTQKSIDGEVLKPSQALVFNDHFVVHGAGAFLEVDTSNLGMRVLRSVNAQGGRGGLETAYTPGANALTCAVRTGALDASTVELG